MGQNQTTCMKTNMAALNVFPAFYVFYNLHTNTCTLVRHPVEYHQLRQTYAMHNGSTEAKPLITVHTKMKKEKRKNEKNMDDNQTERMEFQRNIKYKY